MSVSVTNLSSSQIEVAINEWDGGNTSYFSINPGKVEKWGREGMLGFVMSVKSKGITAPYFVTGVSKVIVHEDHISDNGEHLVPLA